MKPNNHRNNSLFGVTVFLIVAVCIVICMTFSVYVMDDKELYQYVQHEPNKPSKGSGVGLLLFYNMFGRVGVHLFHWSIVLVAFLCWLLYWNSNRGSYKKGKKKKADEEAAKLKAQEQLAQLSKRKSWRKKQEQKRKKNKNS